MMNYKIRKIIEYLSNPPASKASREVANLTERKYFTCETGKSGSDVHVSTCATILHKINFFKQNNPEYHNSQRGMKFDTQISPLFIFWWMDRCLKG